MSASNEIKTNVISDQDRDMALGALNEFNKKNYSACIQSLNKLENAIGPHLKISHNKAVAEFCKSELKKYEQFKKSLNQILGQDVKSNMVEINDIELCVPYFNKALLLFHTKQPIAALKIMIAIIKHIEHLDDNFVQKAGLLTLTLLLDTNQIKKALAFLEVFENRLEINKEILISDEEDTDVPQSSITDNNTNGKNNKSVEDFKKMYKLILLRTYILNGKTILIPIEETADISILKGHQYFLGNDYQMAAKELSKRFSNDSYVIKKHREDQNTYLANNMGLIHFTVRHYAMAVKFFQHALTFDQNAIELINKDNSSVPFYCNAGTKLPEILYNLGIAMLYLQRPKEAFECLLVPLNYYHNNPRLWLRLAEACIMVHKENLKQKENKNIVSSVIGTGLHRKYILKPSPNKYVSDEGQSYAIPSPNLEFASLCLRNAITLIDYFAKILQQKHRADTNLQKQKNKFKTLNVLDEDDIVSLDDDEGNEEDLDEDVDKTDWNNIDEGIQCNPSKPLSNQAFEKLQYAVLGAYCYVLISLGEYTLALKYGKELLKLKNIPDTYKMLANLYCAESLIMMDRLKEALLYLEPKLIKELNGDDFEKTGTPDWNINTLEAAQSIMTYNLAVTLLIKGDDINLAKSALSTCKHPIVFTHLKLLKIYIELLEGNVDNCRMMIRIDTPQHF